MMSIYCRVCRIYTPRHSGHLRYPCSSIQPPALIEDALVGRDRACLELNLETEDRVNSEIQLEAVFERDWRCTRRPRSSELRDPLGSGNWTCWEIYLEAMINQDWTITWRQLIWRQLI